VAGQQKAHSGLAASVKERYNFATRQSEGKTHASPGECLGHGVGVSGHAFLTS
jgi:hypothetical protein